MSPEQPHSLAELGMIAIFFLALVLYLIMSEDRRQRKAREASMRRYLEAIDEREHADPS